MAASPPARGPPASSSTHRCGSESSSNGDTVYHSVDFEVFGKVQGVFFRRDTMREAERLGLVGWVKNTSRDTVKGAVQGPADKLETMKHWLQKVGSPSSTIKKCVFSNDKTLKHCGYTRFTIRK